MNREDQLYVLKWMLDFVEVDIDKLRPKEGVNLLMELDAALSGVLGDRSLRLTLPYLLWNVLGKESPETFVPKKIRQARRLQEHMRTFVQDTFQKIKKARETEGQWLEMKEFQKLIDLAEVVVKETTLRAVIRADHDVLPDEEPYDQPQVASWSPGSLGRGIIKTGRRVPDDESGLISYFLDALDGLPLKSLQECPECGRWFVLPDEKKRTFCSRSCGRKKANRDYHEKKKEADPEGHEVKLAEKREEEHKRYEERQKQKGYKKVDRRPRKLKSKED